MRKSKNYAGTVVEVTNRDINHGLMHSCEDCPVARALRRATGTRSVSAGYGSCGIGKRSFCLPIAVDRFIRAFDGRGPVKPFKFRIGREEK